MEDLYETVEGERFSKSDTFIAVPLAEEIQACSTFDDSKFICRVCSRNIGLYQPNQIYWILCKPINDYKCQKYLSVDDFKKQAKMPDYEEI